MHGREVSADEPSQYPFHNDGRRTALCTSQGEILRYHILSARVTDIRDKAYTLLESDEKTIERYCLELGVQEDENVLALSTCTSNNSDRERLLLFAVME